MTKTELLDRHARDAEERVLLARALDRLEQAERRGVPAHTGFLPPEAQRSVSALLAAHGARAEHVFWGGYEGAERAVCAFLPGWQSRDAFFAQEEGPVAALRCTFSDEAGLSHRDILGSLLGLGITREIVGDILMGSGTCDVAVLREALPILLSQWERAGRRPLKVSECPPAGMAALPAEVKIIRATVAAPRLDAVAAACFSLSRARAAELISSGRVLLNHRVCDKPDRQVLQGDALSCRGLGKCVVKEVGGLSKKGRVILVVERFV